MQLNNYKRSSHVNGVGAKLSLFQLGVDRGPFLPHSRPRARRCRPRCRINLLMFAVSKDNNEKERRGGNLRARLASLLATRERFHRANVSRLN